MTPASEMTKGNDQKRNDPSMKAQIKENLLKKAQDTERLLVLVQEINSILEAPYFKDASFYIGHSESPRGIIHRFEYMLTSPKELRDRANNDTYLGNASAFGERW